MTSLPNVTQARFGGWTTDIQLPPGSRRPGQKATEYAYQYLKHLIVTLELPPLAIITEAAVPQTLNISRTPVRETFLRLAGEQLLDIIPYRGAMVPAITKRAVEEQAVTRYLFESYGVETICNSKLPIGAELRHTVEQQRAIYDEDSERIVDMITADKEFHWQLVRATGNTDLSQLYSSFHDRQLRIGIALFQAFPARRCDAIDEHLSIIEAIELFDLDLAKSRLEYHLFGKFSELGGVFTNYTSPTA